MRQFDIILHSFRQVQEFVKLATAQPFEIIVGNERQTINGKDLMGMFSLDYSRPVQVRVRCSEEDFLLFRREARSILI